MTAISAVKVLAAIPSGLSQCVSGAQGVRCGPAYGGQNGEAAWKMRRRRSWRGGEGGIELGRRIEFGGGGRGRR